jgi:hypothetical protein
MFVAGIRETLVGECQGTKNYQNYSGDKDGSHGFKSLVKDVRPVEVANLSRCAHVWFSSGCQGGSGSTSEMALQTGIHLQGQESLEIL